MEQENKNIKSTVTKDKNTKTKKSTIEKGQTNINAKNKATSKAKAKSATASETKTAVVPKVEGSTATKAKKIATPKLPKIEVLQKKKIIFIGSEAAPFVATGGLADVLGSLPKALAKINSYEVSVILPLYSSIKAEFKSKFKFLTNFNVSVAWRWQYAGVFYYEYQGVKFYFIDNEYYFKRDGNIYGFYDDGERYAFFSRAAIDAISKLNIYPDVIHCNDWQTASSIIFLKGMYYRNENFKRVKTVFTIHNIEYQGKFGMDTFAGVFGFSDNLKQLVEFDGCVNLMKGAIEMSDVVNTVSPTYANELKDAFFAHGLENIIARNSHKIFGILNGIDTDYYNPETDKFLFKNFSKNDLSGKAICKEELQKLLGLKVNKNVPIIAVISRLVSHKGLDLLRHVADNLLTSDVQLVILGKGEIGFENFFSHLAYCYSGKCATIIAYNQDLSRKIYSGADMFLMPSKIEPCGLSQMIASRYGTVPIVRETGGLNDSIKAYTGDNGNGFTFKDYNAYDMLYVINEAIRTYNDKQKWQEVVLRAMNSDFSWDAQTAEYKKLYNE